MLIIPKKFKHYGDLLFVQQQYEGDLKALADHFDCKMIAVRNFIVKDDVMRRPALKVLYNRNDDDEIWATIREYGLTYHWNPLKTMFCAGNTSERRRMALEQTTGQCIVDLYAGVGYFTIPFLKGGCDKLYACEMNPWSVEALKRNLKSNKISADRIVILEGNNEDYVDVYAGRADRVNLGLLPSSKQGYPLAIKAINRSKKSTLHIHENVRRDEIQLKKIEIVDELKMLLGGDDDTIVECYFVEVVKSYSPGVLHVVYDISVSNR